MLRKLLLVSASVLAIANCHDNDDALSSGTLRRFYAKSVPVTAVVLSAQVTEGPFFATINDFDKNTDTTAAAKAGSAGVTTDRLSVLNGAPMSLTLNLYSVTGSVGTELVGSQVYLWMCDTVGSYSAVTDKGVSTVGQKWLRAVADTDANGSVTFKTIIPGWYSGRTLHYHLRVHTPGASDTTFAITTQLFFQDSFQASIATKSPYSSITTAYQNVATDNVYTTAGSVGSSMILSPSGDATNGYSATFNLGISSDKTTTATTSSAATTTPAASASASASPSAVASASTIAIASVAAEVVTNGSSQRAWFLAFVALCLALALIL